MRREGWPKLAFIEGRFEDDRTNWWAPNHAAVLAMLRSAGMRVLARPAHEIYLAEPDPDHPGCAVDWNRQEFLAAVGAERRSQQGFAADRQLG
jgi:tRNA (mo5U34)-methyltransferase